MKDATDIQLRESYNNTISRNIIPEWDVGGISLSDSANNTVSENSMTSCGVHLAMSTGNFIYANNITKSSSALYLYSSNVNKICGNYIAENTQSAIELHNSSYNRISENEIRANYDGIRVEDMSENNSISGNIVTTSDRRDRSGPTDEGGYGIVIEGSSHNDISANSISANKGWGLGLFAEGNSVLRNDITHNGGGIWVIDASDNSLCQNNITANDVGICFWNSSNNSIFHNNFVNNAEEQVYGLYWTINIWDDGYPSGGNYWSDYNGADANRDGIGDTQYIIDENNTDHYPLMVPYVIPEFPSFLILPLFFIATLLAVMIYKWKYTPKVNRG
jgi:parallel beta-helix repeat protein